MQKKKGKCLGYSVTAYDPDYALVSCFPHLRKGSMKKFPPSRIPPMIPTPNDSCLVIAVSSLVSVVNMTGEFVFGFLIITLT